MNCNDQLRSLWTLSALACVVGCAGGGTVFGEEEMNGDGPSGQFDGDGGSFADDEPSGSDDPQSGLGSNVGADDDATDDDAVNQQPNDQDPGNQDPNDPGASQDGPGDQPGALEDWAPQPLRRLSNVEYENTLRDLFVDLDYDLPTLPADTEIDGFYNNYSTQEPSTLRAEQYLGSAMAVADAISDAYVAQLAPCGQTAECARTFVEEFGLRAFRRPLTDSELASFTGTFTEGPGASDFALGVRLTVIGMLQSASFLYRPEVGAGVEGASGEIELGPYEIASRLSYFVWGSMPDDELFDAAASGRLAGPEDVRTQAERMLNDPRARQGIGQFFSEWLTLPRVMAVTKRAEDDWDAEFRAELSESASRFLFDEVFANGGSSVDLLTSTRYAVTPRIAGLLGLEVGGGQSWQVVDVDPSERSGFLTHPAFLGAYGYGDFPSPVLRGVYVMDRILCAPPSPPPPGVDVTLPSADDEDPNEPRTNREAYEQVTSVSTQCAGCHSVINPLGFAFENYDTLGQYRTEDNGQTVDASGGSLGFTFDNGVELAEQIATSEAYQRCVVDKMLTFGFGGGPAAGSSAMRDEVRAAFTAADYSLAELVVEIATHDRFSRWLAPPEAE